MMADVSVTRLTSTSTRKQILISDLSCYFKASILFGGRDTIRDLYLSSFLSNKDYFGPADRLVKRHQGF